MSRRRIGSLLAAAALTVGALTIPASPAAAATGDPGWLCYLPAGNYVYDFLGRSTTCAGGAVYDVIVPADGRESCIIPAGYTGTSTGIGDVCSISGAHMLKVLHKS